MRLVFFNKKTCVDQATAVLQLSASSTNAARLRAGNRHTNNNGLDYNKHVFAIIGQVKASFRFIEGRFRRPPAEFPYAMRGFVWYLKGPKANLHLNSKLSHGKPFSRRQVACP